MRSNLAIRREYSAAVDTPRLLENIAQYVAEILGWQGCFSVQLLCLDDEIRQKRLLLSERRLLIFYDAENDCTNADMQGQSLRQRRAGEHGAWKALTISWELSCRVILRGARRGGEGEGEGQRNVPQSDTVILLAIPTSPPQPPIVCRWFVSALRRRSEN